MGHAQIVELMAKEKGWWWGRRRAETKRAQDYLATFQSRPEPAGGVTVGDSPSAP